MPAQIGKGERDAFNLQVVAPGKHKRQQAQRREAQAMFEKGPTVHWLFEEWLSRLHVYLRVACTERVLMVIVNITTDIKRFGIGPAFS